MTPEEIKELQELSAKAASEPWDIFQEYGGPFQNQPLIVHKILTDEERVDRKGWASDYSHEEFVAFCLESGRLWRNPLADANAELIVALRNAAPRLLSDHLALLQKARVLERALEIVQDGSCEEAFQYCIDNKCHNGISDIRAHFGCLAMRVAKNALSQARAELKEADDD